MDLRVERDEEGIERQGNSGTAGLSVSDTPKAKAVIRNNVSIGWHLGIFAREARSGIISGNTVRNNCIGVLVFDDSTTELPTANLSFIGGDWAVVKNSSIANNRFCLAGRDMSQHVSGVGMAVANADHVLIANNTHRRQPTVGAAGHTQLPARRPVGADRLRLRCRCTPCHNHAVLTFGVVVLGVADVQRAADFWCQALGYRLRTDGFGGWATVLVPPGGSGALIALQRSETVPQEHPRLHLDLHVPDATEQAAEVQRLVRLGASRVDWDSYPDDPDFVVLADPDGNRFCIVDLSHG